MKVQKFSQSTFLIENSNGKRILIDPGKYNFEHGFTPDEFSQVDVLIVTHKHADHFDLDAVKSVISQWSPIVITNSELASIIQKENIKVTTVQAGDEANVADFKLNFIRTDHTVRDEKIINFGLVIEADGNRIYYTSDTTLIDLEFLPKNLVYEPDILCVPISDRGVVMGIDDALFFTNEIKPKIVIPMHYDSPKDKERVRPEYFVNSFMLSKTALPNLARVEVKVLSFGETLDL